MSLFSPSSVVWIENEGSRVGNIGVSRRLDFFLLNSKYFAPLSVAFSLNNEFMFYFCDMGKYMDFRCKKYQNDIWQNF